MPLLKEWSPAEKGTAAVWRIREDEEFFLSSLGAGPQILSAIGQMKAQKRRLEFLAGRYLLRLLVPGIPLWLIRPDEHDKPRLPHDPLRFSLSHSFPFVAVMTSETAECGIDIQKPHPRIDVLQNKFLSAAEKSIFSEIPSGPLLAWTMKEAAYKWQGRRGVDFIRHLSVLKAEKIEDQYAATIECRLAQPAQQVEITGWCNEDYCLSLAIS